MAYTKYSLTPSSNTAAPPDGAPEGMLPSAVNDTMRDMMAQIRDCGDGIRGGTYTMTAPIITGGTINGATIGATTASTGKFTAVTNSALTSGRVTYAGTAGVLQDDADFTFNGTTVTMANDASISGLTVGKGGGAVAFNTAFGFNAGAANTTGTITAIGTNALRTNTTGNANTALGGYDSVSTADGPLFANTTGSYNIAVGTAALRNNTTGSNNTAQGFQALNSNTTANNNTAVGYQAGYSNTTGLVTAVGYLALFANTTGTNNTAVGRFTLGANTTGIQNTAIGRDSTGSNTTGGNNSALGYESLLQNTTGSNNVSIGSQSLFQSTTASNNTAVGYQAIYSNTTASNNTGVGYQAGYALTTGANNTCLGLSAGYGTPLGNADITTGSNNIYVGGYSVPSASGNTSEIVIGYNSIGKGSSTGFMNAGGGGNYAGNNSASWSTISDKRIKKNIVDNNIGLEKIMQIQVRNFEYRKPEEVSELPSHLAIDKDGIQLGVIAQELQQILPKCVKEESTGFLSVDSSDLTWYLINAIKELNAKVEAQALEIAQLKAAK